MYFKAVISLFLLSASLCMMPAGVRAQTTATDFSIDDCSGMHYHLFSELDAGKVIVGVFVMPCVGCISPSNDVQNVVSSYVTSHPGKVEMYLFDDDATTPCSVLTSWRNANGIHLIPTFSDSAVIQDQYGTPGMPKIVVLGGTDHKVWGNQNDVVDIGMLYNQIDAALGLTTGIASPGQLDMHLRVSPNPASSATTVSFQSVKGGSTVVRLIDMHGRAARTSVLEASAGENSVTLDLGGIAAGTYSILVSCGNESYSSKFLVK